MLFQIFHKSLNEAATHSSSTAFAALIWWLLPLFAVGGAIVYVIWVSKFQDKFQNETNRSVDKFSAFQQSFRGNVGQIDSPPLNSPDSQA